MAKESRAGRPSKSAEQKRSYRVNLSLTADEHLIWIAAAEGGQLSAWAREVVNAHVQTSIDDRMGRGGWADEIAGVRAELRKIGTNINQIARAMNVEATGGPAVEREAVALMLASAADEMKKTREALQNLESGQS